MGEVWFLVLGANPSLPFPHSPPPRLRSRSPPSLLAAWGDYSASPGPLAAFSPVTPPPLSPFGPRPWPRIWVNMVGWIGLYWAVAGWRRTVVVVHGAKSSLALACLSVCLSVSQHFPPRRRDERGIGACMCVSAVYMVYDIRPLVRDIFPPYLILT